MCIAMVCCRMIIVAFVVFRAVLMSRMVHVAWRMVRVVTKVVLMLSLNHLHVVRTLGLQRGAEGFPDPTD